MNYGGPFYDEYLSRMKTSVEERSEGYHILLDHENEIWRAYKIKNDLLEGIFWQKNSILFPYVRATYVKGQLHGYRICLQMGSSTIKVNFYKFGQTIFEFNCYYTRTCCRTPFSTCKLFRGNKRTIFCRLRPMIYFSCLNCLIVNIQEKFRRKKIKEIFLHLRIFNECFLVSIIAFYLFSRKSLESTKKK